MNHAACQPQSIIRSKTQSLITSFVGKIMNRSQSQIDKCGDVATYSIMNEVSQDKLSTADIATNGLIDISLLPIYYNNVRSITNK